MSIWRRLFAVPAPPRLKPALGRLYVFDDDNIVHVYKITCAEFNVYTAEALHWLTLYVAADLKIEPNDNMNPEPFLEVNLYFQDSPEALLEAGVVLKVTSYHEEHFNLASMYYWTHSPFDGGVHVEAFEEDVLTARVEGESDNDPVVLRAKFQRNPERKRSFI